MGFDKAFLQAPDGRLLIEHHVEALRAQFDKVVLVAEEHGKFSAHAELGRVPLFADLYPGMGPLGGICTAFEETGADYIFAMACDMPQPDFGLVAQMAAALPGGAQVSLCAHGGRLETLFAFYHKSCVPVFRRQIAENRAQPRREFAQFNVHTIQLAEQEANHAFLNLNTPEEWRAWARGAGAEQDGQVLDLPRMALVGSPGRGSGKTVLACELIENLRKKYAYPVVGLKVISIDRKDGKCQRGHEHCGLCTGIDGDWRLTRETGANPEKDTAKLLAAGADEVYLLVALKSAMGNAVLNFLAQAPQNAVIVAESNSLRNAVKPGVFLFAGGRFGKDGQPFSDAVKPSAQRVLHLADHVALPGDGTAGCVVVQDARGAPVVRLAEDVGKQDLEKLS